jgi:hypothetical protein
MARDGTWFGILLAVVAAGVDAQESRPESRAASRSAAADQIRFELLPGVEASESRPAESRGTPPVAIIRVTNKSAGEVILWPLVSLQVRNEKGEEPKPSTRLGRWGRRKTACFLEAVTFATLQPGKSIDWPVRLDRYTHDPAWILGWKLPPGEYTLTARYSFVRSDFIARCKLDCESHPDPRRPWNQALELSREATLKITVK